MAGHQVLALIIQVRPLVSQPYFGNNFYNLNDLRRLYLDDGQWRRGET